MDQATEGDAVRPVGSGEARAGDGPPKPAADVMDKYARDPDTHEIVLDAKITLFEAVLLYTCWDGLLLYSECDPGPSMSELRYELYMATRRRAVYSVLNPLLRDALKDCPPKGAFFDLLKQTRFHIGYCELLPELARMPSLMRDVERMISLRLAPPPPGETPEEGSRRMRSEDERIDQQTSVDRVVMREGREPAPLTSPERDGEPANPLDAESV
jgi:hypothetical protein